MKSRMAIAFALIVIGLTVLGAPGHSQSGGEPGDKLVQTLKSQIVQLESRIAAIQRRIDVLESTMSSRPPICQCPGEQIPRGSKPYGFNGMKVWRIPVDSGSLNPDAAAK